MFLTFGCVSPLFHPNGPSIPNKVSSRSERYLFLSRRIRILSEISLLVGVKNNFACCLIIKKKVIKFRRNKKVSRQKCYPMKRQDNETHCIVGAIVDMVSRRISPKYFRAGRGDLWLAVGLDTRGLDSPWVWFRSPSRRRYVNVIMGVINPARTRLNLARSLGAARGPRIATVHNPSACSYRCHLCVSLHADFTGY